ncbi:MAG: hypothetical protein WAZ14_03005 [Patescibacteria group bacterium]
MDTRALKGRILAALTCTTALIVIVIFLLSAGKTPVLLIILTVLSALYSTSKLKQLRASIKKDIRS